MSTLPTCREVYQFLDEFHAGELDPMRTSAFERHLALCPSCRAYVDSYRRTIELEKDAFAEPDLADPPDELVDAILAIRRTDPDLPPT
ncbi:MAG TPA: zf-HC2 domain-containing protein [Longimicrobium sp.]|nr:zf-HC2 domain-containing protein [Longimicrobium sp.]